MKEIRPKSALWVGCWLLVLFAWIVAWVWFRLLIQWDRAIDEWISYLADCLSLAGIGLSLVQIIELGRRAARIQQAIQERDQQHRESLLSHDLYQASSHCEVALQCARMNVAGDLAASLRVLDVYVVSISAAFGNSREEHGAICDAASGIRRLLEEFDRDASKRSPRLTDQSRLDALAILRSLKETLTNMIETRRRYPQ